MLAQHRGELTMKKASVTRSFAVGVDYGTNSARALIVDISSGLEIATSTSRYLSGHSGVMLHDKNPNLARQKSI